MKTRLLLYALLPFTVSCKKSHIAEDPIEPDPVNKLLMLQVDHTSNELIGGRELSFEKQSSTFTLVIERRPPIDLGFTKLYYKELNELIFYGTQIFIGTGEIIVPDGFYPARHFEAGESINTPFPSNGLEGIDGSVPEPAKIWNAIKHLALVKKYMRLNPRQKVKLFYYNPASGLDVANRGQWIIILKN